MLPRTLPKLFNPPVSASSSSAIMQQAHHRALKLFHQAVTRVPAYQDFIYTHGIDPQNITTFKDFCSLPPTTKQNYIEKYSPTQLCWDGMYKSMHMISTSSGTTGEPHFWPRDLATDIEGAMLHRFIFSHVLGMEDKNTLFINGFALGNWIAGTFTSSCTTLAAWQGLPVTLMSPGYDAEAIINNIKYIGSQFDQIVITGHTPFLKEIIEQGQRQGVVWKNYTVKLLGTGQAITENWRDYMNELLGTPPGQNRVFNLYGSADAALMGFETLNSITFRRYLSTNTAIARQFFNDDRLPSLYHFDPRLTYFESINGELHVTKYAGIPLIRYNMLDEGGVLSRNRVEKKLEFKFSPSSINQLPIVYLFGRDKFMVKLFGANIYTEHAQHAFNHKTVQPYITGRFFMEIGQTEDLNQQLICRVELAQNVPQPLETIATTLKHTFIDELEKMNVEYQFIHRTLGDKVEPHIILYPHGDAHYFPIGKIKKTT